MIAYHYCHNLDADRYQCLINDSDTPEAKLMGVEYIISEKLFNSKCACQKCAKKKKEVFQEIMMDGKNITNIYENQWRHTRLNDIVILALDAN